ncbi:MAG: hypothetical protein IPG73_12940 [Ignavibacteria bacterium]|nr:hypothetical protein [Ignavibacteria bacterium]
MEKTLMTDMAFDEVHNDPNIGLKFRNLNNPKVYYDDVHRGYILNYRNIFYKYATYLLYDKKDTVRAGKVLQRMNQTLSLDLFPLSVMFELQLARFYETCGLQKEADDMAMRALASAEAIMKTPALRAQESNMPEDAQPELIAADASVIAGKWDLALRYYRQLGQGSTADPILNYKIDEIEIMKKERAKDFAGALAVAEGLRGKYSMMAPDRRTQQAAQELEQHIVTLQRRLGRAPQPAISMVP